MSIQELIRKIKESSSNRTHEERLTLLKKANILDSEGYYSSKFFSTATVEKDKKRQLQLNV